MKVFNLLLMMVLVVYTAQSQTWNCGDNFVDPRDNQAYKTVLIGNQCWMAENLNYGTMIQNVAGQGGQMMQDNGVVEKYCWNNDVEYCDGINGKTKKGGFYEFKEAMQYYGGQPTQPTQGVCPDGWHIPSYEEINTLISNLGGDVSQAYTRMIPGGSSGFEAVHVGYRCTLSGSFRNGAIGTDAVYYWISEQSTTNPNYARFMVLDKGNPQVQLWEFDKSIGISVRCLKNISGSTGEIQYDRLKMIRAGNQKDGFVSLRLFSPLRQKVKLSLFDIQGKTIYSGSFELNQGENDLSLSLCRELKGIFILNLKNSHDSLTQKLVF